MAITNTTSSVYINVIEDVVNKVCDEFLQTGGDLAVLNELQGLWEMKMMQCGAICGPIERTSIPKISGAGVAPGSVASVNGVTPVHDLNVPYEPAEEYETPTADMLFPPTPLQAATPNQTPLPGSTPLPGISQQSVYNLPTPSDYSTGVDSEVMNEVKPGRPSPYMKAPSAWMNQRPLGVDVNIAYVEGRDEPDRGTSHQNMTKDFFMMSSGKRKREDFAPQVRAGGYIPQQDGAGDAVFDVFQPEVYPYQGVASEDYNTVNTPAATHDLHAGHLNLGYQNEGEDDDEEPPLNENDDDEVDEVDEGDEPNTHHLVLAQFDKVSRTKSKWKCTLKDGIMHINNKDILFAKATGEFDF